MVRRWNTEARSVSPLELDMGGSVRHSLPWNLG
jgi:hypothetical protein